MSDLIETAARKWIAAMDARRGYAQDEAEAVMREVLASVDAARNRAPWLREWAKRFVREIHQAGLRNAPWTPADDRNLDQWLETVGPPPRTSAMEYMLSEDAVGHLAASRREGIGADVAAGHRYTYAALRDIAERIREASGGESVWTRAQVLAFGDLVAREMRDECVKLGEVGYDAHGAYCQLSHVEFDGKRLAALLDGNPANDLDEVEAKMHAMKLRALAVHAALWAAMKRSPGLAYAAIVDGGSIHEAVHALIAIETTNVTVPTEWAAHMKRQDHRIAELEAIVADGARQGER